MISRRKSKSIAAAIACVLTLTALTVGSHTEVASRGSRKVTTPVRSATSMPTTASAVTGEAAAQYLADANAMMVAQYVAAEAERVAAEEAAAEADRVAQEAEAQRVAAELSARAQAAVVTQPVAPQQVSVPVSAPAPSGCAYESLIRSVFIEDASWAVSIAMRESGCRADAYNPSGASGLFQLLGHENIVADVCPGRDPYQAVFDPVCNVNAAHVLYLGSGRAPWNL